MQLLDDGDGICVLCTVSYLPYVEGKAELITCYCPKWQPRNLGSHEQHRNITCAKLCTTQQR